MIKSIDIISQASGPLLIANITLDDGVCYNSVYTTWSALREIIDDGAEYTWRGEKQEPLPVPDELFVALG
jgi:hypothetical protein